MTTIATPLGCSRSELNSQGAGGYEGESRSRALQKNSWATPCAADTEARRGHRPRLLHGKSVAEIAEPSASPRPEFVATAAAVDGPTAPGGLWRSQWRGTGFFLVLLSGPPVVSFFDRSAAALF